MCHKAIKTKAAKNLPRKCFFFLSIAPTIKKETNDGIKNIIPKWSHLNLSSPKTGSMAWIKIKIKASVEKKTVKKRTSSISLFKRTLSLKPSSCETIFLQNLAITSFPHLESTLYFFITPERRIESITRPPLSQTALEKVEKRECAERRYHSKLGYSTVVEKRPTLLPFNLSNSLIYLLIGRETLVQFGLPRTTTSYFETSFIFGS